MLLFSYLSLILFLTLFFSSMNLFSNSYSIFLNFPLYSFLSLELNMNFILDWFSLLFSSSVLLISSAVIIYSSSYIPPKNSNQFYLVLFSFIASMILLIFSNNIFFTMLGWDGLGLTSYILVIFYQNHKAKESGTLTILSNRMGDIFIILSISILMASGLFEFFLAKEFPFLVMILLILASFSKSAQAPFSAWLPAAMAAPTPISALVHSSTLVTAGVYLLIRLVNFEHPKILLVILIFSSMTMFFSGLSANWEQDMKKIIALSTLSQIAMMMFAISIKSTLASFFHLITHAFFKSTMFLCAGIMIHLSSYQDFRFLNSSKSFSPSLMLSFGVCNLALLGLPFLAGFYSKDLIMELMMSSSLNSPILLISIFALGLTASYSIRLSMFTFSQKSFHKKDNLYYISKPMILPVISMAPISVILGSSLIWFILPNQFITIPYYLKFSISFTIMLGMLFGFLLMYKSKTFNTLGESSISLWFLHFISCLPLIKFLKKGENYLIADNTWTEFTSAQGVFIMLKTQTKYPNIFKSFSMMMMAILFMSPLMMF